jgi:hypothetical protein
MVWAGHGQDWALTGLDMGSVVHGLVVHSVGLVWVGRGMCLAGHELVCTWACQGLVMFCPAHGLSRESVC